MGAASSRFALAALAWSQELATGHADIDDQHRDLVFLLTRLREAHLSADAGRCGPLVERLEACFHAHFAAEEALMALAPADPHELHRHAHRRFLRELACRRRQFQATRQPCRVARELDRWVSSWFISHMALHDLELGS